MADWNFLARSGLIVLLFASGAVVTAHAQRGESDERPRSGARRPKHEEGEPPPIRGDRGPPEWRGFPGGPPPPGAFRYPEPASELNTRQGFLFLNGSYVAPPYVIRQEEGSLTVNGQVFDCLPPPGGYGSRGGYSPRSESLGRYVAYQAFNQLNGDLVLIAFKDQPYLALDGSTTYDFLKALTTEGGRALRQLTVREQLPSEFDKAVWDEWLANYEPPGELLHRAAVVINAFEANQRAAEADMRASKLLNQLSYPLAVGGMVLSVLAIGHVLGGRPHARQRLTGLDPSPEMIQSLNWSLLFVAAFSLLDLTWTILAANAGQMQELNPIGSHLINNPRHLAGFKLGITMPSLVVLWLLRKYKRAQVAAWWLCLVLTLVTLRWLTFSPLMAG